MMPCFMNKGDFCLIPPAKKMRKKGFTKNILIEGKNLYLFLHKLIRVFLALLFEQSRLVLHPFESAEIPDFGENTPSS